MADAAVFLFDSKEYWQQMLKYLDAEPIDAISVSTMNCRQSLWNRAEHVAVDPGGN